MTEPVDPDRPTHALERLAEATADETPGVIGGTAGALIGYALGGVEGVIASALVTPPMVATVRLGLTALIPRLQRGSRAIEVAAHELDVDLEELAARATADPARLELLARVLEAAGRTTLPQKINALGQVLAGGLADLGNVDEARLLANALDVIEEPHLQLLAVTYGPPADSLNPDRLVNAGRATSSVLEQLPGYSLMITPILHVLEAQGLIENIGEAGGMVPVPDHPRVAQAGTGRGTARRSAQAAWRVTTLGKRCLELLGHPV